MESDYSKFLLCKQDLIHYIKDLKEWNELNNDHDNNFLEGLLSKCETMDECNQDSDDDSDLDSLEDSESDEDFLDENKLTPHEYLSLACDTFSQLIISNVSLGSINNVLDEFIDSSGKNGLELTTCCTLCYIQTQQIEDPTALRGLFYRFIEPDNLFGSELIILNSLEEYCLPYSDTLNFQQNIIEILQKLGILHCNSIKAYKSLTIENPHYTPTFDSDSSSNSLWTFTNNDCNSFDHGRILCDSACDFHSNHSTKSCDVSSIDSRSTGDRNNEQDCKKSADILKEIPLEEYNFRFSDVSKIREYYIPTDDDVETRTILYDYDGITKGTAFDDSEMEISFEDD
ncbi:hypothetical protein HDV02_003921 [Globomyces sp. JEL0801]|nr:hypothetical protein HDV02_003921 [Globomyces sp. JEL0801]